MYDNHRKALVRRHEKCEVSHVGGKRKDKNLTRRVRTLTELLRIFPQNFPRRKKNSNGRDLIHGITLFGAIGLILLSRGRFLRLDIKINSGKSNFIDTLSRLSISDGRMM